MLVDPNYGHFKTNITNMLDVEEDETSRSHTKKIAVLHKNNEIPDHLKVKFSQSCYVQTEITSLKYKIMNKIDFSDFGSQTEEIYFPYDAKT